MASLKSTTSPFTGLEYAGIAGRDYLKDSLSSCLDPIKAIQEFQTENGILLPSLRTTLPLLDLHGIKRKEFHTSTLEDLTEHMIRKIEELGKKEGREKEKKLLELLQKSYPLIMVPSIKPVVLAILQNMDRVEEKYLKKLILNDELYKECGIQVKRQIWQEHHNLFSDEVYPLFKQYIDEKSDLLFKNGGRSRDDKGFFSPSPKQRRQGEIIQKLVNIVGRSPKLYEMILQFLRSLFHRSKNVHYCTLRTELLMSLHDLEIQEITSTDPCHKFAWCLDACIREKHLETKRSRELQSIIDNCKNQTVEVIGDIAMSLADPFAINLIATLIIRTLCSLLHTEGIPRDNPTVLLLLRLLNLGLNAWEIVSSIKKGGENKLNPDLIVKFLPLLMCLIVDDQVRNLNAKLPQDDRESAIATIEHSGPAPESFVNYIQGCSIASILAMYYALYTAKLKDRQGLMRILGTLSSCHNQRAFEDTFLHSLVGLLVPMADEFATGDFCTLVFDEFFFNCPLQERVLCHLIRLLGQVFQKLPPNHLELVIQTIKPIAMKGEDELIKDMFSALEKLIDKFEPPSSTKPLEMDSPLLSVPTPSPMRSHF